MLGRRHFQKSRNYFPAVSKKQSAFAATAKSISQEKSGEFDVHEKPLIADDVRPGDMVEHPQFGSGLVISIQGLLATIAFKRSGVKKMMLGVAPLRRG